MANATALPLSDSARHGLRMLVAPVRSGTTAFLHTVSQHPDISTLSFVMKDLLSNGGQTNYSIYTDLKFDKFLLYKATFGYSSLAHCKYMPFRSRDDLVCVRPLFLFREPIQTFNSWFKKGWTDRYLFVAAYTHAFDLVTLCRHMEAPVAAIAYEHLAIDPLLGFSKAFAFWGMPFNPAILSWQTPVGEETLGTGGRIDTEIKLRMSRALKDGVYESLATGGQRFEYRESDIVLAPEDRGFVEGHLCGLYQEIVSESAKFLGKKT